LLELRRVPMVTAASQNILMIENTSTTLNPRCQSDVVDADRHYEGFQVSFRLRRFSDSKSGLFSVPPRKNDVATNRPSEVERRRRLAARAWQKSKRLENPLDVVGQSGRHADELSP
jgi:hypothetical protein